MVCGQVKAGNCAHADRQRERERRERERERGDEEAQRNTKRDINNASRRFGLASKLCRVSLKMSPPPGVVAPTTRKEDV